MADPYVLLGVTVSSSAEEVRTAYLTLVEIYHPDRFGEGRDAARREAQERLKSVTAAYEEIRKNLSKVESHGPVASTAGSAGSRRGTGGSTAGPAGSTAGSAARTSSCPSCHHPQDLSGMPGSSVVPCGKCGAGLAKMVCKGCRADRLVLTSALWKAATRCPRCPKRESVKQLSCPRCMQSQTTEGWAFLNTGPCTKCHVPFSSETCPSCNLTFSKKGLAGEPCPSCSKVELVQCGKCQTTNRFKSGTRSWACASCKTPHYRCSCGRYSSVSRFVQKWSCQFCGGKNRR
jgi:hypothetical protein